MRYSRLLSIKINKRYQFYFYRAINEINSGHIYSIILAYTAFPIM